ncbi:fungal-specific transcription factor domain-containing protein [Coniochaeta sp. 2T2.1]|nr:fungal-specific transcription factor domain-containing protein [Coniochaeta sp. 2T2.1]
MRTRKSCDACHSRKIKCDLALPQCDWCFHRKLPCTFMQVSRTSERSRPPRSDSNPTSDDASPGGQPTSFTAPPAVAVLAGVHFGKVHFAGRYLGNISSYNGIPFLTDGGHEWIQSCAGEKAVFPALPESLFLDAQMLPGDPDLSLPSIDMVEDYLRFFRSSHLKLEFPVVDSVMFQHTIRVAYGLVPDTPPHECMLARASVFAFMACLSLFEGERRKPELRADGDACALKARRLLSMSPQDLGITTLQTALMLTIHLLFSGQIPLCAVYHSLACRVTFMLGGHLLADPWTMPDEPTDTGSVRWSAQVKRHLRKLFWLCYLLDKEISLRTGQPPSISDEHCDLTLPGGYMDVQYHDEYFFADVTHLDESAVPLLPADLRLTMIKSKACTVLYSAHALRKSDADLLRDVRELDEELETWRLSVPPKHRPVLSLSESSIWSRGDKPKSVRTVVINFEYHYLMATIHQATSRCRAWTTRGSGEMDSVRSSLALAVEASRSALVSLRYAVHGLLEEASWTLVFYPMSAALTIFCNLLWDPLHPRAQEDLHLLSTSPELIRCIRRRRMTENEMLQLRVADEFLAELARLGRCAISKARHEQDHLRYWG